MTMMFMKPILCFAIVILNIPFNPEDLVKWYDKTMNPVGMVWMTTAKIRGVFVDVFLQEYGEWL